MIVPTAEQLAVKAEFQRLHNMTVEEMVAHYASDVSDSASIDPRAAKKLKKRSGLTDGKQALGLKNKAEWDEADYTRAAECNRGLKRFMGRQVAYQTAEGAPTLFAIAMMNRGHDPRKTVQMSEAELSADAVRTKLQEAIRAYLQSLFGGEFPDGINWPYVRDVFPKSGYAIVEWDGDLYKFNYLQQGADVLIQPDFVEVQVEYVPVALESFPEPDPLRGEVEAVAESEGETGPKWTGVMIRAGAAKNRAANGLPRVYTAEALKSAVAEGLFDHVPGYQVTDGEHGAGAQADAAGWWGKAWWDEGAQAVKNVFTWVKEKYPSLIHQRIKTALAEGRRDMIPAGFSIQGTVMLRDNVIDRITKITSCDPISFASAGGEVIAISESHNQETPMKFTDALKAKGLSVPPALATRYDTMTVAEGDASTFMISELKAKQPAMFEEDTTLEASLAKNEKLLVSLFKMFMAAAGVEPTKPADAPTDGAPVTESQPVVPPDLLATLNAQAVEGVLTQSGLDDIQKTAIRKRFAGAPFNAVAVQEAVREAKEMQDMYGRTNGANGKPVVLKDATEKVQEAVYDFFFQNVTDASVRKQVREAENILITPHARGTVRSFKALFGMLFPGLDPALDLAGQFSVAEAMDSALATKLLTNGINAKLMYRYGLAGAYEAFRAIINPVPQFDYQTKSAMAYGGFSGWGDVSASADYNALTDSGLTSESYTIVKKGGLIGIAEEHIRNDNVGYIAALPDRLADEAKRRLSAFVWNLVTSNPTLSSDSTAVFAAGHANLLNVALSSTALRDAIGKLQAQQHPNSTDRLMSRPAFLAVSFDPTQQEMAYKLVTVAADQNNSTPAWAQSQRIQVIVNPHTSDVNDWYLFGDKAEIGIIELGLLDGNEVPEVAVSQMEGVGAWFTKGEAQWRVKHAYSGTWVSHRGSVGSIVP